MRPELTSTTERPRLRPAWTARANRRSNRALRKRTLGDVVESKTKRIAYVTGGMGGIGTAICRRLYRDGYTVIAGCGPGSTRKDRWLADMRGQGLEIYAS